MTSAIRFAWLTVFSWALLHSLFAQQGLKIGESSVHGSFQSDAQYYFEDEVIQAQAVDENLRSNTFLQLTFQQGKFSAGVRYEAYLNELLGFRPEYRGQGIPYRFAKYSSDQLDITVGNIYDQFGSGMVFRSYQEWFLGIDNSVDGVHVRLAPVPGLQLKGLVGTQRKFFERSKGILRGGDLEADFNQLIPGMEKSKTRLRIGGSAMSRFLEDESTTLQLPENVTAFGGRMALSRGKFSFQGEYAYKINDPFNRNNFVYNDGNGIFLTGTYSQKGLGITAAFKRIDNMDFRSERSVVFEELTVNFLPPTTLQHTYRLPTLYPYATQPNGEIGGQIDFIYRIPKKTALGGKYGTQISVNYSRVNGLDTSFVDSVFTYESSTLGAGDKRYFEDFNIQISKKWNKRFKTTLTYIYLLYNIEVVEGLIGQPDVRVHVGVLEGSYKIKRGHNLRCELQHMYTKENLGSWAMALAEYSISPHWFFTVFDEYNYGNPDEARQAHYYNGSFAYVNGGNRIQFGYGRQRAGLLCVGGICRFVPASNGFTLSLSSTF
ncbi:MAG: DUF6029 family protein [Bacteroidota bacterium]